VTDSSNWVNKELEAGHLDNRHPDEGSKRVQDQTGGNRLHTPRATV